jgi:hypothetical protein
VTPIGSDSECNRHGVADRDLGNPLIFAVAWMKSVSLMSSSFDEVAEQEIRAHVLNKSRLGIYDPLQPKRPQVEVAAFIIDLLEYDEETSTAHAAGTVILRTSAGEREQYLRVSVNMHSDGRIVENADLRAAYIVETNPENGACKETAALANA